MFLAVKEIPDTFIDQLAPGGSLVGNNKRNKNNAFLVNSCWGVFPVSYGCA